MTIGFPTDSTPADAKSPCPQSPHSRAPQATLANAEAVCEDLVKAYNSALSGKSTLDLHVLYSLNTYLDRSRTIVCELINATRPINKLPVEILTFIFSLVPDDIIWHHDFVKSEPTFMQDVRDYCPLLLVCSNWYRLITGMPSFWSTIVDYIEPRQESSLYNNYISRCPSGPLCVFIRMGPTPEMRERHRNPFFNARVRQLVYNCNAVYCEQRCLEFLRDYPFPDLDTCILAQHNCSSGDLDAYHILPFSPRLRCLHICSSNFIPTTAFPLLEEFRMRDAHFERGSEVALWAFLMASPRLQTIELDTVISDPPNLAVPNYQQCSYEKMSLDSLRTVILKQNFSRNGADSAKFSPAMPLIRWFAAHVAVPPTCAYRVGPILFRHLQTFHSLFNLTAFASSAVITECRRIGQSRSLLLDILSVDNVRLAFEVRGCVIQPESELEEEDETDSEDGEDGDDEGDDDEMDDEPELVAPGNTHRVRIRFSSSLSSSMLSSLRRLRVGKGAGWTLVQPSSILFVLPHLEALVIADPGQRYGGRIWYTITEMLDALMPIPNGTAVCPALKSITVDCVSAACVDARESPDADNPGPLLQKFKELAVARGLAGLPVERFFLFFSARRGDEMFEDGDSETSPCLLEYDADANLLCTARDKAASDAVNQEWERYRG
ncbi:hypothetical protein C8Q70DRAFT_1054959 [Cubamyces menziesii]|nr:hypothetical protein C8Q70DRAFT_1054959 [Cubamyces menziesii]